VDGGQGVKIRKWCWGSVCGEPFITQWIYHLSQIKITKIHALLLYVTGVKSRRKWI